MNQDYKVLGLTPGADQDEIKKAYFRQIRRHTPEKDPEGFRRLREAYDRLRAEENADVQEENAPVFPPFETVLERQFAEQIEQCKITGNCLLQRNTAEEAWKRFPGNLYFLYQLTIAQQLTGNSGKAVKNAELLVKKEPGNKWFQRELALSLLERGYTTKAWHALGRAYAMGCRDRKFLVKYLGECQKYVDTEQRVRQIFKDYFSTKQSWNADDMVDAFFAASGLLDVCYERELGDDLQQEFDLLTGFIDQNAGFMSETAKDWSTILALICGRLHSGNGNAAKAERTFRLLRESAADEGSESEITKQLEHCIWKLLDQDEQIDRSIKVLYAAYELNGSDKLTKTARMDALLCMLKAKETVLAQLPVLEQEYPMLYNRIEPYVSQLQLEGKALEELRVSLELSFREAAAKFPVDFFYYKWYPEEKKKALGRQIASGEDTYTRQHKKIGRNDPCPCGSGRKFKQCCMNKGIYD